MCIRDRGYIVHGIKRRASLFNTQRVDHIYQDPHIENANFHLHYGDLTDTSNLVRIVQETRPDEIYNLGAQSHVAVSFESPEYTADVDGMGTLRLLEAIRILGLEKKTRFYQASTSELFGLVQETPQKETTPFYPRSPYAVAKMYAYWITVNYREAYGIYACNGILFNHESPRRGETFVTRKITRGLANISQGLEECLFMGNIDALRDWGHAKDYVRMQWMMLQQDHAEDFVIATGVQYSVRQFIEKSAVALGMSLRWEGEGANTVGCLLYTSQMFRGPGGAGLHGPALHRAAPRFGRLTRQPGNAVVGAAGGVPLWPQARHAGLHGLRKSQHQRPAGGGIHLVDVLGHQVRPGRGLQQQSCGFRWNCQQDIVETRKNMLCAARPLRAQLPEVPVEHIALQPGDSSLQLDVMLIHQWQRPAADQSIHAWRGDPMGLWRWRPGSGDSARLVQHPHSGRTPGLAQARHGGQCLDKAGVAHGEILGAGIKGSEWSAAGGHTPAKVLIFLENRHLVTRLSQRARTDNAGHPSPDDGHVFVFCLGFGREN